MNITAATTTGIGLVIALALTTPGLALHCNGAITTLATPAGTFYLDDRSETIDELDHWLYLESNDVEGLQSGSPVPYVWPPGCPGVINYCVDPCDHANPDLWLI